MKGEPRTGVRRGYMEVDGEMACVEGRVLCGQERRITYVYIYVYCVCVFCLGEMYGRHSAIFP